MDTEKKWQVSELVSLASLARFAQVGRLGSPGLACLNKRFALI